jgi:hypothetical protein
MAGYSESDARRFLERELGQAASSTSFYWESDELEDLLDMMVDAVAKLIASNNERLLREFVRDVEQAVGP